MTQAWNLVLRPVMQRVEVGDKALHYMGEEVNWKWHSFPGGRATRPANAAAVRASGDSG